MSATFLALAMTAALAGDPEPPRKANPLAPSLPLLTEEEEDRLDEIIDRFIDADLGRLAGEDARKAARDFDKLGPEAIPALIRGLNKAAKIEGSCPAVLIARKLSRMLAATQDAELLEFARENIGAGVGQTRHRAVLQDLRVGCMLRKSALARGGTSPATPPPSGQTSLRSVSTKDLAKMAGKESGERLKDVLTELATRRNDEALGALANAAGSAHDPDAQQLARELILRGLSREAATVVKERLTHDHPEVRCAAVKAAAARGLPLVGELIDLLEDEDGGVREAAHGALVPLARGQDFGPSRGASPTERSEAVKKWRAWWQKQR
jgi:hypothetical protein